MVWFVMSDSMEREHCCTRTTQSELGRMSNHYAISYGHIGADLR